MIKGREERTLDFNSYFYYACIIYRLLTCREGTVYTLDIIYRPKKLLEIQKLTLVIENK